ncbi:MAG: GAF domain-containing protein, partial [Chloroflexi bacterium]|nr:GAF domain-containing protein [Chloroflexota bacterium]
MAVVVQRGMRQELPGEQRPLTSETRYHDLNLPQARSHPIPSTSECPSRSAPGLGGGRRGVGRDSPAARAIGQVALTDDLTGATHLSGRMQLPPIRTDLYYRCLRGLYPAMPTALRSRSLRTRILGWSLLPTLLVLLAIALVSHFAYQAMAHDLVLERDRELTRLLASELGTRLEEYAGTPSNLSRAEGVYEQEIMSQATLFRRLVNTLRPRMGSEGIAYLVNDAGRAILHSDAARLGASLEALPPVQAVLRGEIGALRTYDEQGVEVLASYAPVPGTSWGLVIEQPWSSLTTSITGYQRAILALMAGGVLLLCLLVIVGVRRITGPLRQLVLATRSLAEGDFQPRLEVRSGDELETLAAQFNRMALRLQDSYQTLTRRAMQRGRELQVLNAVTAASSLASDLAQVLSTSLYELNDSLGLEAAGIWLTEPASGSLRTAACEGTQEGIRILKSAEGMLGRLGPASALAAAGGQMSADLLHALPAAEGSGGLTIVPIMVRSVSVGLLVALPHPELELGPEAVQLLTTVGTQLGLAVDSHRLFADARRRADLFRLISDVGGLITSARSLDELLRAIVTSIHERLGYELVGIGLTEGGHVLMKAGVGGEWDRPGHQPPCFVIGEQGLIGWCAAAGEPVLAPDVKADRRYLPLPESDRIRSELVVPLRSGDEVLGVLDVQSEQLHAFTGVDRA